MERPTCGVPLKRRLGRITITDRSGVVSHVGPRPELLVSSSICIHFLCTPFDIFLELVPNRPSSSRANVELSQMRTIYLHGFCESCRHDPWPLTEK